MGSEVWASGVAYEPFAQFRHGDLLARMVGDVDAIQDLSLRVLQPAAVAAAAATGLVALLLPSAAAVLLTALLMAAVAVPAATA